MSILGFSFPQLLALFVLILAFIPLVGGVVALVVVSLILLISGWQMALTFAIVYFIYLQVEAYVISPRIMSRAVSVPGGVAIIAVAAGGALWGVLGALIAIPVAGFPAHSGERSIYPLPRHEVACRRTGKFTAPGHTLIGGCTPYG